MITAELLIKNIYNQGYKIQINYNLNDANGNCAKLIFMQFIRAVIFPSSPHSIETISPSQPSLPRNVSVCEPVLTLALRILSQIAEWKVEWMNEWTIYPNQSINQSVNKSITNKRSTHLLSECTNTVLCTLAYAIYCYFPKTHVRRGLTCLPGTQRKLCSSALDIDSSLKHNFQSSSNQFQLKTFYQIQKVASNFHPRSYLNC